MLLLPSAAIAFLQRRLLVHRPVFHVEHSDAATVQCAPQMIRRHRRSGDHLRPAFTKQRQHARGVRAIDFGSKIIDKKNAMLTGRFEEQPRLGQYQSYGEYFALA